MNKRLARIAAAAIAACAGVITAVPAAALDDEPTDPTAVRRPDLQVTTLNATPVTGNKWSITFRVSNNGNWRAPASTLKVSGVAVSVPLLEAGTGFGGSVQVPITDCYAVHSAWADATNVVTNERDEYNNRTERLVSLNGCTPRYSVRAVSFTAIDESGIDWTGSDEPYWMFSRVSNGGTEATTRSNEYGDTDTGETKSFGPDGCLWGCGNLAGAQLPYGIGLSVQLWETDAGTVDDALYTAADAFKLAGPIASAAGAASWVGPAITGMGYAIDYIGGWYQHDLLGTQTYAYSLDDLTTLLPSRGSSFYDTRVYEDGGARYRLVIQFVRVV